jgi:hypothetical protein
MSSAAAAFIRFLATLAPATVAVALAVAPGGARAATDPPAVDGLDLRDLATRHYFNTFDGLMLDRNPHPAERIDDAETFLEFLSDGGGERTIDAAGLSSVRVMAASPGVIDFVAVTAPPAAPPAPLPARQKHASSEGTPAAPAIRFLAGRFLCGNRTLIGPAEVELVEPSLTVSLKDLTLSLRGSDGAVVLVYPIGAGGFRDETSHRLMTPAMRPEVTRTPGRAYMERSRYQYQGHPRGRGYMIASRTHPDYYDGLPFVRLRRFDQPADQYGLHGPISRGGTYPLSPGLRGEALARLKRIAPRHAIDPEGLLARLFEERLVADDARLVRGRITNGCIRLRERDIRELHAILDQLPLGAPVTITLGPDPSGASHPFPWETRRFAVATPEKDADGLTVMYTGQAENPAGKGEDRLPFPGPDEVAHEDERAARDVARVLGGAAIPEDLLRLRTALRARSARSARPPAPAPGRDTMQRACSPASSRLWDAPGR